MVLRIRPIAAWCCYSLLSHCDRTPVRIRFKRCDLMCACFHPLGSLVPPPPSTLPPPASCRRQRRSTAAAFLLPSPTPWADAPLLAWDMAPHIEQQQQQQQQQQQRQRQQQMHAQSLQLHPPCSCELDGARLISSGLAQIASSCICKKIHYC